MLRWAVVVNDEVCLYKHLSRRNKEKNTEESVIFYLRKTYYNSTFVNRAWMENRVCYIHIQVMNNQTIVRSFIVLVSVSHSYLHNGLIFVNVLYCYLARIKWCNYGINSKVILCCVLWVFTVKIAYETISFSSFLEIFSQSINLKVILSQ